MAREHHRIQTDPLGQFLHHTRYIDAGKAARLDSTVPRDRPEQRPASNCSVLYPLLQRAHGAGLRIRTVRNTDLSSLAGLIRLGTPKCDRQAILAERTIIP